MAVLYALEAEILAKSRRKR